MGERRFDQKFGASFLDELPQTPAVYLFKDGEGRVIYAGKAKNIRRRMQQYRLATRRKAHRKMRRLVAEAQAIEIRPQASELDALLAENELIRTLRPRHNVDGAFSFLYPAIGLAHEESQLLLAFTTRPGLFAASPFRWFGAFRSRSRARDAFAALDALFDRLGHREPRARLPDLPRPRGSRVLGFRRLSRYAPGLERYLSGEDASLLGDLATDLLEKRDARESAEAVGIALRQLDDFFASDTRPLREALRAAGQQTHYVGQSDRDALFIRFAAGPAVARDSTAAIKRGAQDRETASSRA